MGGKRSSNRYHGRMSSFPRLQLSRLRQIGWDEWDPIGLGSVEDWRADAPDEYDSYLLYVVSMLRNGQGVDDAAAYLDRISSEHMGLGQATPEGHRASLTTANAIAAYLKTLSDGPLNDR